MKSRNYKNFDELFYQFNRELLLDTEQFDYVISTKGFVDDLILQCDSYDCTLNIGDFGFKKYKWTTYTKSMIDKDKLLKFREELKTSKSSCCTYVFDLQGNGLFCIVLKRHDSRGKWKCCDVFFETVELQRGFAVDLVFLHIFLRELPKSCCNIKSVNMFISQAYSSALYINGYLEWFDVGVAEMNQNHPYTKALLNAKRKYFTDKSQLTTFNSLFRLQQVYFELIDFPEVRVLDLELGVSYDGEGKEGM